MYWIYVPPIIFIAGLIVLVVILGRKSAALRKRKLMYPEKTVEKRVAVRDNSKRLKKLGSLILRFAEGLIFYIRIGIKKAEAGLTGLMNRIKEKRGGKREPMEISEEDRFNDLNITDDNIAITENTPQERTAKNSRIMREIDYVHEEVTVRRKPEIIPKRVTREPVPEDKVKEDALVHRIAENPRDIEAYREIGDYYLAIGNIKDAKESFKMVLKLRPRDLKAKSSLREIELRMRLGS